MFSKLKTFLQFSKEDKKLFFEAFFLLGVTRVKMVFFSFKELTGDLKQHAQRIETTDISVEQRETALRVGRAVRKAARYTLWESACLAQALVAWKMLEKRGIKGLFHLGAAKDGEEKTGMKAHAWSQCGDLILTGGEGHEAFRILSTFEWEGA